MNGTDLELLERYTESRDAEAFAELVARNRDMVYAACYRVLGRRSDAEDAAQECFLALARSAGAVKTSLAGWLHRVAVRTAVAMQRRSRARSRAEREAATMLAGSQAEATWDDVETEIDRAIDRLPEHLREPLVLHFLQGKTQTVAAQEMGVSQSVVSVRIKEAIDRLRGHLKGTGLAVTAAGLAVLLGTHGVEAAPATLVASLGKVALAGVAPASAPAASAASALGVTATIAPGAKIACVVIAAVAAGLTLREAVESHGSRPRASSIAQPAPRSLANAAPAAQQQARPIPGAPADREAPKRLRASAVPAPQPTEDRHITKPRPSVGRKERSAPAPAAAVRSLRVAQAPAGQPAPARPQPRPGELEITKPGVTLRYHPRIPERVATNIASTISVAKAALERSFPDLLERRRRREADDIFVYMLLADDQPESTTTDHGWICIRFGENGVGENSRGDTGGLGLLCQAVAELHNPERMAGLDRYIAHRHLVPAVLEELTPGTVTRTDLGTDGAEILDVITSEAYMLLHPDLAAVGVWREIEERLGLEGLNDLLRAMPDHDRYSFAFMGVAIGRQPDLEESAAVRAVRRANQLTVEEDGTSIVASFEDARESLTMNRDPLGNGEIPLAVRTSPGVLVDRSPEWATHGEHSLKFHGARVDSGATVGLWDPDWRYGDWTRYDRFEMDLLIRAAGPTHLQVRIHDDVAHGHARLKLFNDAVDPDQPVHVSWELNQDNLQGVWTQWAWHFAAPFRAAEVASLEFIFVEESAGPVALYIDNLRLTPRMARVTMAGDGAPGADAGGVGPAATEARLGAPGAAHTGVTPSYETAVDEEEERVAAAIRQVIDAAWEAIGELLPDRHLVQIHLKINRGRAWHENVVTDRDDTIHVRVGPHGIGDAMRGDAGPIAVLCEAVADLHNFPRVWGFNRYMAHRHLVPAAVEKLGEDVLPCPHPTSVGSDGAEILDAMTREEYTSVHPDIAAAAALLAIEERFGFEGLRGLLDAVSGDGEDTFAELRELAIEADPQLADAFAAYDEAMRLEPDEDGTCLVTSFEPEESVQCIPQPYPLPSTAEPVWLEVSSGVEWAITDDWATDGSQSLRMDGDIGRGRMDLVIRDPDWRFRDLRRFSEFEFDLLVEAAAPQRVGVCINDHVADGHGQIDVLADLVRPGEWRHVAFELTGENLWGRKGVDAPYFGGQFRADSASRIHIGLGQLNQPVTFHLDNLRFRLRDDAELVR